MSFSAEWSAIEAEERTLLERGAERVPLESVEDRARKSVRERNIFSLCALYSRVEHYGVSVGIFCFESKLLQLNLASVNGMAQKDVVGHLKYDFSVQTLRNKCSKLYLDWAGAVKLSFQRNVQERCPEIFLDAENAFGLLALTVVLRTNGLQYCKLFGLYVVYPVG